MKKTPQNTQKLVFIDIETTGLNENENEIVEFSAIITNDDASEVLDKINLTIKPELIDNIDPKALKVCHKSVDDLLANEYTMREAHKIICEKLEEHVDRRDRTDKLQFIAYNSEFDEKFVRELFTKCEDKYFNALFWNPSICMMKEIAFMLRNDRNKIDSFKLESICYLLDIEFNKDKAHNSLYDIERTLEVFKKSLNLDTTKLKFKSDKKNPYKNLQNKLKKTIIDNLPKCREY